MRLKDEETDVDDDGLPDEDELPMMMAHHLDASTGEDELAQVVLAAPAPAPKRKAKLNPKKPETWGKVGRNDDCPCGSGKRYKHCHGAYV